MESPQAMTLLSIEDLEKYFLLFNQVEELLVDDPGMQSQLAEITSRFDADDQCGAYNALQLLHKKITERESAEYCNEKLQALADSYPEELMKQYPEEAKSYKIKLNMALSLCRTKRVPAALKFLDEMEAIQKRVIAAEDAKCKAEAEAKRKAEEEAKRKAEVEAKRKAEEELKKFTEIDCNGVKLGMVKIPAGTFMMGSPKNELGRFDDEKQHQVILSKDYYLGKYPVTQIQWHAMMGNNPSKFKGDNNRPVETVSWNEAKEFCDELNKRYAGKLPYGYKFDLPTEAQWEYACRAGIKTALNSGNNLQHEYSCRHLTKVAWYLENNTHSVGQKRTNAWGLCDMHGNVYEWCRDWYGDYGNDAVTDPAGPQSGSRRVCRGGSWNFVARKCRSACRGSGSPSYCDCYVGFRLALVPEQ